MDPAQLMAQIVAAFPLDPRPTLDEIIFKGTYCGDEEKEIRLFFNSLPWTSVTPQDVFRFRHALPLFSRSALVYFSAAWMATGLIDRHAVDTGIEDLISNLNRANPTFDTGSGFWLFSGGEPANVPMKRGFCAAKAL